MRVQAVRQKREAIEGAASQDAWTLHVTERSMLQVADPNAEPQQPAQPAAAPTTDLDQNTDEHVSENEAISQDMAFETWMSTQPWNQGSIEPSETGLRAVLHQAMADRACGDRN